VVSMEPPLHFFATKLTLPIDIFSESATLRM